jgi:hypothetical protein
MASSSAMNSQVVGRKEASAGGLIRPLITYALLSFLPPAKEPTSNLKARDARAEASEPASAAPSDLPSGRGAGPSSPAGDGMQPPHGRFPGKAGKIFYGEPTAKSEMTDFWP